MSETWFLLQSGLGDPAANMAWDEALLDAVAERQRPILRFYGWAEPAATFGYFQKFADVEKMTNLRPLIRRPTGGGLVPHDADWTYSFVFPPTHPWHELAAVESYARVHAWVQAAFARLGLPTNLALSAQKAAPGQCFIGAEKFDLLASGEKIAGAAQRRNRRGLLIQGSVQPPAKPFSRADWEKAMCIHAANDWGVAWQPFTPDDSLMHAAGKLTEEKYSQRAYNEKR
ncbi:MAG: lipoate--protein ligase family protein [Verrucomicrobia bacterium]|nr:lipoate--protein ligase family protein [Verrucomicrobiota bacterium]